ncbi:hypothetical protein [Enterococcus raffinosus]|uniref:hypothetical protein n=1 Tax=Enterococcus raffinosus TaxID=71452 RepID=UPI003DA27BFE
MFNYDDFAVYIVKMQKALMKQGQDKQEAFNNALAVWSFASLLKNQKGQSDGKN